MYLELRYDLCASVKHSEACPGIQQKVGLFWLVARLNQNVFDGASILTHNEDGAC